MVFSWLVMAWRRATCPTKRSDCLVNGTTVGVNRPPSELTMIFGSPPSITATAEFVVPRSIPMAFPTFFTSKLLYLLGFLWSCDRGLGAWRLSEAKVIICNQSEAKPFLADVGWDPLLRFHARL